MPGRGFLPPPILTIDNVSLKDYPSHNVALVLIVFVSLFLVFFGRKRDRGAHESIFQKLCNLVYFGHCQFYLKVNIHKLL